MLNDGSQFMGSDTRHAVTLVGGDRLWQGARIHRLTLICPKVFPVKLEVSDYRHTQHLTIATINLR